MPLLVFIIALICALFGIKKVKELASDPHTDKDFFPDIHNEIIAREDSDLTFSQIGGTINDASAVNRTPIYGIIQIQSEEDIRDALHFAKKHDLKVSIAGAKHSMGGQAFAKDALVLDMREFKAMSVDTERQLLTVQSGAIWHDIQVFLNPYHLSVKAMQSIDAPTVGGTISANAHGMDHRIGGIASTIKSMRLMTSDGKIRTLSKHNLTELFQAVIGGYGFLGVILDVELTLMDNLFYIEKQQLIATNHFMQVFKMIEQDKDIHMFYARLSTAPSTFLHEMLVYTYEVANAGQQIQTLRSESYTKFRRLVLNLGRKNDIGKEIKWWGEKHLQSKLQPNLASRNQIMHRSYAYLKNNLSNNTDVLQEYFLPKEKVLQFINELGIVLQKHAVVTRNVEIRAVYKENILLDYAKGDWFGVVLYLNFDVAEVEKIKAVHKALIDLSQRMGGSFYLPYMLSASKEQFEKSYPQFDELLKLKKKYDTDDLFTSEFYKKYM
jgi:FAD/FMN-containing dehydrogenase